MIIFHYSLCNSVGVCNSFRVGVFNDYNIVYCMVSYCTALRCITLLVSNCGCAFIHFVGRDLY